MIRRNRLIMIFGLTLVITLFFAIPVQAHRVIVFGWVEGDRVMTSSKFSSQRAVTGGEVLVFDETGKQLLSGKTDRNGEFSFKVPGPGPLKIVLNAGSGHKGTWTIPKEELGSVVDQNSDNSEAEAVVPAGDAAVAGVCNREAIKAVVEKSLDSRLRPILRYVAASKNRSVSLHDIISGFGYILGLVGLAAYMRFRSESRAKR